LMSRERAVQPSCAIRECGSELINLDENTVRAIEISPVSKEQVEEIPTIVTCMQDCVPKAIKVIQTGAMVEEVFETIYVHLENCCL